MKNSNEETYKLHSECIVVFGHLRSIIVDLPRNDHHFIPNSLAKILRDQKIFSLDILIKKYGQQSESTINEYLNFLKEKEFIFECDLRESKMFPAINLEWKYPAKISNAIIDIDCFSLEEISKIFTSLEELLCMDVQVRFFSTIVLESLIDFTKLIGKTDFKSVEIMMPYSSDYSDTENFKQYVLEAKKIKCLIIHSAPEISEIRPKIQAYGYIFYITEQLTSKHSCGLISASYFSINIQTFTESQHHNTCLNRKISIDVNGEIKNCPSMAKSYGNIKDTKLIDVVNNPEFQKVWHIKKDEITKCKDCEFRHICTDCRAYIENPEDQYSAPLKCGYDPYTCEWEEWSTNPLKQQAIEFWGMQELVKKDIIPE